MAFLRGMYGKTVSSTHIPADPKRLLSFGLVEIFCATMAAIFGVAWWVIIQNKSSARSWGLGASTLSILLTMVLALYSYSTFGKQDFTRLGPFLVVVILISAIGVFAFRGGGRAGGHGPDDRPELR